MFEDVEMVIFCVSLTDYDQFSVDGTGCLTNKMVLSRKFFETIVTHPTFEQIYLQCLIFDTYRRVVRVTLPDEFVWNKERDDIWSSRV